MKRGRIAVAALALPACFFAPRYAAYPRCDRGPCPSGWICVAEDRVCVPECGEGCVGPGDEMAILPSGLSPAPVCTDYVERLTAVGGKEPYSFALVSGTLPAGVTLSETGALAGRPPSPGTFEFQVQADDASNPRKSGRSTLALTVDAGRLTVVDNGLAGARLGSDYSRKLNATGGEQPYTWYVCAGTLPPGIQLEAGGDLKGRPETEGTFPFTAAVRDARQDVGAKSLTLTVVP